MPISAEDFEKFYRDVASEGAFSSVDTEILSALVLSPTSSQVNYHTVLHSELVGDLAREMVMNLTLEDGQWRVQWDEALLMPELAGGNRLSMERYIPSRANIYDREGHALVAQTDATAIGLRPALIDYDNVDDLFSVITTLTGLRPDEIQALIDQRAGRVGLVCATGRSAGQRDREPLWRPVQF